jgi:hypothetical protein
MLQSNLNSPSVQLKDSYQWLEERTRNLAELDPESPSVTYAEVLQKIYTEGLEIYSRTDRDNPVLLCRLEQLVAEVLLDLALVEKESAAKRIYLDQCHQSCKRVLEILKENDIPGFTASILPRVIAILGTAYQCPGPVKSTFLENTLRDAGTYLERSLDELETDRRLAVDGLFQARFLATSIIDFDKPSDRQIVLEKAAGLYRQALTHSRRALDSSLEQQAEGGLTSVEQALAQPGMPVPGLPPLPGAQSQDPLKAVHAAFRDLQCPQCGTPIFPDAKFCHSCGAPLAVAKL